MRKICLTVLLSLLLICVVAMTAAAAGEFEVNAVATSAEAGGAMTVDVTVDNITADGGLESVEFVLTYSSNVTYSSISATLPNGWEMWTPPKSDTAAHTLKIAAVDEGSDPNPVTADGQIKFTITFNMPETFEATDAVDISFTAVGGSLAGSYGYVSGVGNSYSYSKYPVSIEVTKLPAKKVYVAGQKFYSNGMIVAVNYNDGTSVEITDYTVHTPDMTQDGVIEVLVEWENFTTTFNITINLGTLNSLTVTAPAKTEYNVGDTLDTTGMVVTANYQNNVTRDVTADAEVNTTVLKTAGTVTVTVTYSEKTATFDVTVEEPVVEVVLTGITVKAPTKTEYAVNATLDTTGMTVTANYSDGTTADVTAQASVNITKLSKVGTVTVTVSYEGMTDTFTVGVFRDFAGTNVNMGNELDINFFVNKSYVSSGSYAEIVRKRADGSSDAPVVVEFSDFVNYNSTLYKIVYKGIAAKEMCDELIITIFDKDGNQITVAKTDSIRDYAVRNIDKSNAEVKKLLVDMLNYGAAAQTYTGYNTSDLANSTLTEAQKAYGTQTMTEAKDYRTNTNSNYVGTSFDMGNRLTLNMYIKTAAIDAGGYLIVTFTNHFGNEVISDKIYASELTSNGYKFNVNEIVVADGRCLLTCKFYKSDGTEVVTVTDSLESYVARMVGKNSWLTNVMNFSDSAYAYLH